MKSGIEVESPARSFVVNDRVVMHLQARVEAVERGRTALTHSGYVSKHSAVAPCAAARSATGPRVQLTSRYVHGRASQPRSIELSTSAVSVSGSLHLSAVEGSESAAHLALLSGHAKANGGAGQGIESVTDD